MTRTLRKLIVPEDVQVIYKGTNIGAKQTLQQQDNNQYTCTLPELKEMIRFTVRGEDYYTPYKRIEVVPPPEIETDQLMVHEEQPAYTISGCLCGVDPRGLAARRRRCRRGPSRSPATSRVSASRPAPTSCSPPAPPRTSPSPASPSSPSRASNACPWNSPTPARSRHTSRT